jgi:hypothetical protein
MEFKFKLYRSKNFQSRDSHTLYSENAGQEAPHARIPLLESAQPNYSFQSRLITIFSVSQDVSAVTQPTAESLVPRATSEHAPSHELPEALLARAKHHPLWYIRGVMYLVGILHTRHHVSFSACGLILRCFKFLFKNAPSQSLLGSSRMPTTLKTVLSNLDMTDKFLVHPICHNCHRFFDTNTSVGDYCKACDELLFDSNGDDPVEEETESEPPATPMPTARPRTSKPIMVSPMQLPSRGLVEFFKRPGMFHAVNSWKTRLQVPGEMRCMQDGAVWQTIKGRDNELFFYGPGAENEIRVGITLSLDWYVASFPPYPGIDMES